MPDIAQLEDVAAGGWVEAQALVVAIVSIISLRLVLGWTSSAMRKAHVDRGTEILVKRGLVVIWIILTIFFILGILGVNPTGLIALFGAVGLAFSLAMQDILKNFFSGVYLLLERPFRVGDTIKVKDQTGVVENIGVRTTQLRTADNVQVLVPNATVFGEVVANHTYQVPAAPPSDGRSEADQAQTRA